VEVKLGKPTLEGVGESGMAIAWEMPSELAPPGMEASGEDAEEWIDIDVAVELQPWPDHSWLLFWQEADLEWPERFGEPVLDGRRLIFSAREDELQDAWEALKARVESANLMYREDRAGLPEDYEPDPETQEALRRLREVAQRCIDELT
jgi:hypothetical protein